MYDFIIEDDGQLRAVYMGVTGLNIDDLCPATPSTYSGQQFWKWYNGREAARIDSECRAVIRIVDEVKGITPITVRQEAMIALQKIRQLPAGAQIMMMPFSRQLEGMIATHNATSSIDARMRN